MNVSDAVASRISVREFTSETVSNDLIKELLVKAGRSPSGGNLQPWRVFVLNGDVMQRFQKDILPTVMAPLDESKVSHLGYPDKLKQPYKSNRHKCGMDLYKVLGIERGDKEGRNKQLYRNFDFFGAPAALLMFVDKNMLPIQWTDTGIFLQTFMLLLREQGLDSCPQGFWARYSGAVAELVGADTDLELVCGLAIGHKDTAAPVNTLVIDRDEVDAWASFVE